MPWACSGCFLGWRVVGDGQCGSFALGVVLMLLMLLELGLGLSGSGWIVMHPGLLPPSQIAEGQVEGAGLLVGGRGRHGGV